MALSAPQAVVLPAHGVLATEIVHPPGFSMAWQRDSHHEVFHLLRGRLVLHAGDDIRRLTPGDYCIVPAGTAHRLEDVNPATLFLLCVAPTFIDPHADRVELWSRLHGDRAGRTVRPDAATASALVRHWRALLALQRGEGGSPERLKIANHTDAVLLLLEEASRRGGQGDSRGRVDAFRRHLIDTLYERWTVERAARHCGLSVRRFSGLYREIHGTTVVRDLQKIRIQRACELLDSGIHSIPGAAYTAGFEDLSHFYRVFRSIKGCPPGRWLDLRRSDTQSLA